MSRSKPLILSTLIILTIFLLAPTFPLNAAKAENQTRMFVHPDRIVDPTLTPSENFTIFINVSDVTNFFTWQATLRFDPSLIECTDAYYPEGHVFDGYTNIPVEPTIDNVAGSILHGCTLLLDAINVPQGVLCAIDFHVLGTGSSDLTLEPADSFLLDGDLNDMPFTLEDGYFSNRAVAPSQMFVSPETIINPDLGPSSNFTIFINVSDVTDLFCWQMELSFDPSLIECTDAYYPEGHVFDGYTHVPVEPEIDNTLGYVLYGSTLLIETVNVSQGVLCALEFHVLDRGSCQLTLDEADSFLLDYDLNRIPITLTHGYFDNHELPTGNKMWTEPPEVILTSTDVGKRFNITVWVELNEASYTWQIRVPFDATYLQVTRVDYTGDGISEFFEGHTTVPVSPAINNTAGYVWYGETLLGTEEYREPGSGSLCWIEFETVALPPKNLFIDPTHQLTFVLNPDLEDLTLDSIERTIVRPETIGMHDVAVINVVPSATSVIAGQSIAVDVTVENQGDFAETFSVTVYYDGTEISSMTISLSYGESDLLPFIWDTTGVAAGTYVISAEADVVPGEGDVADNFFEDGIIQVLEPPPYIPAVVNLHPETLNLKSKGRWITCIIQLPEGYSVKDIDLSTIMLNDTIPAMRCQGRLMVKFSRAEVVSYIHEIKGIKYGSVNLQVTGELYNGVAFEGDATIRVRMPGDVDCNGKVNVWDLGIIARKYGDRHYPTQCDLDDNGKVNMRDISITARNFGKNYRQ